MACACLFFFVELHVYPMGYPFLLVSQKYMYSIILLQVPPQTNGFDCGVFMLTYIESLFKVHNIGTCTYGGGIEVCYKGTWTFTYGGGRYCIMYIHLNKPVCI